MKGTKSSYLCYYQLKHQDISKDKNIENNSEGSSSNGSLQGSPNASIKNLVNTPFKKAMFIVQILSYFLIVGSPVFGGAIGGLLKLNAAKTGGIILGIFITGEIMFYGSLIFLGKEVVRLLRTKMKSWFKRRSSRA